MRILVVEDNNLLRHHLSVQMRELGHQVDAAENAKEADFLSANRALISRSSTSACREKTA